MTERKRSTNFSSFLLQVSTDQKSDSLLTCSTGQVTYIPYVKKKVCLHHIWMLYQRQHTFGKIEFKGLIERVNFVLPIQDREKRWFYVNFDTWGNSFRYWHRKSKNENQVEWNQFSFWDEKAVITWINTRFTAINIAPLNWLILQLPAVC